MTAHKTILAIVAGVMTLSACGTRMSLKMIESQISRCGDDPAYLDYREGKARWNYTPGLELRAYFDAYEKYGGQEIFEFSEKWYDGLIEEDGTIRTYKLENYSIDHICPGKSLLYLYDKTGKEKYLKAARTLIEQLKTHPRTSEGAFWHKLVYPHQVWLDGVYMGEPFYIEYACRFYEGEELKNAMDEVVNEFEVAYRHTFDPETKLLRHAWDESRSQQWCDPQTGQSAHCWARALGWYLMAATDVLDYLPETYSGREALLSKLRALLSELPKWADPQTGMWYQVLDCPGREGNYLEATACAMFTYVFLKSVRLGYIDAGLEPYARGLYDSLVKTFVSTDSQGRISLEKCCSVGGLGGEKKYRMGDYSYYLSEPVRPNDSKGIGPFIWASLEIEGR